MIKATFFFILCYHLRLAQTFKADVNLFIRPSGIVFFKISRTSQSDVPICFLFPDPLFQLVDIIKLLFLGLK